MDQATADAYLDRIGARRPARPDRAALATLQRAHLGSVPFENLSIHLGEPIVLDQRALVDKVVRRRRGGFCYELNGAFAALLTTLGFRVSLLAARVFDDDRAGMPFAHMALRVDLDEPLLVDVGFGDFSHHPLRLDERADQADPAGVFRVVERRETGPRGLGPEHVHLDVLRGGGPEYRLDPRPYELRDFVPACWYQQTSPDSHFTRSLTCSMVTESGRVTLSGARFIRTTGGRREESVLVGEEQILSAYRTHFGIMLDRVPTVD